MCSQPVVFLFSFLVFGSLVFDSLACFISYCCAIIIILLFSLPLSRSSSASSHVDVRFLSLAPAPRLVPPPTTVQSLNGFSAKVSWVPPTGDIRGPIDRYELKAYSRDQSDAPPIKAVYLANGNFTGETHTNLWQSKIFILGVDNLSSLTDGIN